MDHLDSNQAEVSHSQLWKKITNSELDDELVELFKLALPTWAHRERFVNFAIRRILALNHKRVFWGDGVGGIGKAFAFLDDPLFAQKHVEFWKDYDLIERDWGSQTNAYRLHTLVWAAQRALALPLGDFVECGVFEGDMSWFVGEVAGVKNSSRNFFLYDSFKGLDESIAEPDDYPPEYPDFVSRANTRYPKDGLVERVIERFRSWKNYHVVPGYLPGSLDHDGAPDAIAYLHVDLNSPAAELGCYHALFPKLVPGATIILDDYGWDIYKKQRLTADKFFGERGIRILELPTGQGLAVNY